MIMSAAKKQRLLTQCVLLSDDDDSGQEFTETVTSATSMSDGDDVHQLKLTRKFLSRWKYLFLWVEVEHKGTKNELLYCHDCKAKMILLVESLVHPKVGRKNISEDTQNPATTLSMVH